MTQNDAAEVAALYRDAASLYQAGQLTAAAERYREILKRAPDQPDALHMLGLIAHQFGRYDVAVDLISRAIRYDSSVPAYHLNQGLAYQALNRFEEGIVSYQNALNIKPDYAAAHFNLGRILSLQGKPERAVPHFQRVLAIQPSHAEAYYRLGNVWGHLCKLEEAITCYQRALALKPDYALAYDTFLCALLYRSTNNTEEFSLTNQRYAELCEGPLQAMWPNHGNSCDPGRRLNVGYVSPDFREHSVASYITAIFAHHDKSQFAVTAYYNHTWQDEATARIQAYADRWVPCQEMTDEALAERIRADGIDILVDLAGHMVGNRLLVFARKPAPVQVTYLGYPATTGLSAMDYRLVTADTDPPGAEGWHSEKLYPLPRSLWCYRPPAAMPAVIPQTPAQRSGHVTFGSMNNLAKISDITLAVWSRLLKAVSNARLVMTGLPVGTARRDLQERFAALGIEAERLVQHGRLPAAEYYALLNTIDIALDPFPYTGTTTTCESLWMGVPVVTLIGETSVARSGYALLKGIGLEELAARDEKEYVAIAASLATDLERLDALRGGMRQRIASSPLRDEAGLTRDLEAAYRAMWRAWCNR